MGIKSWIARRFSSPSQYAETFASAVPDLGEYLAASFVAFSGSQEWDERAAPKDVMFETHFDMEQAGFSPGCKDIAVLVAPGANETAGHPLFGLAYRHAISFICAYSDNVARGAMKPPNAEQFSRTIYSAVATRCAGHFGFEVEPRAALETITGLVPALVCKQMLNIQSFGTDDGLGNLLRHLNLSSGRTRYAFVVGSQKQSLGCASAYLKVLTEITDGIERCAQEVGW